MADNGGRAGNAVELTISDAALSGPVLERLVSAAAVQAALPVDRLVNALSAVDALVAAADDVLDPDSAREFSLLIEPGRLQLSIESLGDGQAEELLAAARLPGIGDVLERVAESVATTNASGATCVAISLE